MLRFAVLEAMGELLALLEDEDWRARSAGGYLVAGLARHGEIARCFLQGYFLTTFLVELQSALRSAIPRIVRLLTDRDGTVRRACVVAIGNLAEEREF